MPSGWSTSTLFLFGSIAVVWLVALKQFPASSQFPGASYFEDTGTNPPRDVGNDKSPAQKGVASLPSKYWPSEDCDRFFLDLGGNRGDSIDRWFRGYFGRLSNEISRDNQAMPVSPNNFCVLSFEGNPRWTKSLQEVSRQHMNSGRKVFVFPETVVFTDYLPKVMYIDGLASNSISSSIYTSKRIGLETKRDKQKLLHVKGKRDMLKSKVTVQSINFSDLLFYLKEESQAKHILVKMDIEGAEYDIIRHALASGTFCFIDTLFIEWHQDVREALKIPENFEAVIKSLVEPAPCNVTVLLAD